MSSLKEISLIMFILPIGIWTTCITSDITCCFCNDTWLCGVTSCPRTTIEPSTTVLNTPFVTETTTVTTTLLTTTTVASSTTDHLTDATTSAVFTTTRRTITTQTVPLWEIIGYVASGTMSLLTAMYLIHALYWYVLRIFERRSRRDYDSFSGREELASVIALPMSRHSVLNITESTA